MLVWSFAIIFYLLNSVNVRLFFLTNIRFCTLFTSFNGALNFIFAGILLFLQMLAYLFLFKIIKQSKRFNDSNFIKDAPLIKSGNLSYSKQTMAKFLFLYDEYKNNTPLSRYYPLIDLLKFELLI